MRGLLYVVSARGLYNEYPNFHTRSACFDREGLFHLRILRYNRVRRNEFCGLPKIWERSFLEVEA